MLGNPSFCNIFVLLYSRYKHVWLCSFSKHLSSAVTRRAHSTGHCSISLFYNSINPLMRPECLWPKFLPWSATSQPYCPENSVSKRQIWSTNIWTTALTFYRKLREVNLIKLDATSVDGKHRKVSPASSQIARLYFKINYSLMMPWYLYHYQHFSPSLTGFQATVLTSILLSQHSKKNDPLKMKTILYPRWLHHYL